MRRDGVAGVVYAGAARPMNILGCPMVMAGIALVCFIGAAFLSHIRPIASIVVGLVGFLAFLGGRVIYAKEPFLFSELATFIAWRGYVMGYVRADDSHDTTRDSVVAGKV